MPSKGQAGGLQPRKLRSACDLCHTVKVRCSGGKPCQKCRNANTECHYSYAAKLGKPKGSLNKKTLAKLASASTGNFNLTMDTTKDRIQQHQEDLEQHTHTFSSESDNNMGFPPPQPIDPEVMGILDWQSLLRSLDGDSVGDDSPNSNSLTENGGAWTNASTTASPDFEDTRVQPHNRSLSNASFMNVPGMTSLHVETQNDHCPCVMETMWSGAGVSNTLNNTNTMRKSPLHNQTRQYSETRIEPTTCQCQCLKILTDHLCYLNTLERQQQQQFQENNSSRPIISVDVALNETDATLRKISSILDCLICRLDSKVLLLVLTVSQTVVNWIKISYYRHDSPNSNQQPQNQGPGRDGDGDGDPHVRVNVHVSVSVGAWQLSEADGNMLKLVLTSRVLASAASLANVLRLRIEDVASASRAAPGINNTTSISYSHSHSHSFQNYNHSNDNNNNNNNNNNNYSYGSGYAYGYQFMDIETLQQAQQRLMPSLRELRGYIRALLIQGQGQDQMCC